MLRSTIVVQILRLSNSGQACFACCPIAIQLYGDRAFQKKYAQSLSFTTSHNFMLIKNGQKTTEENGTYILVKVANENINI